MSSRFLLDSMGNIDDQVLARELRRPEITLQGRHMRVLQCQHNDWSGWHETDEEAVVAALKKRAELEANPCAVCAMGSLPRAP